MTSVTREPQKKAIIFSLKGEMEGKEAQRQA